jgi:hypothetical protein
MIIPHHMLSPEALHSVNELPRSKLRGIKPQTQHPKPEKLRTTPTGPLDDAVACRPFRFLDF